MRVMKFGGTSVAGAARMRSVVQQVAAARAQTRVFVVASAVSGVTQLLLDAAQAAQEGRPALEAVHRFERLHGDLAQELQAGLDTAAAGQLEAALAALVEELRALLQGVTLLRECSPQVLAHLSSFGERAACLLLGAWMDARGLAPQRVDPRHVLPCSGDPLQATPGQEALRARLAPVREGGDGLWLMPGFFGGDAQGRPMCLGRGGSDYSAALVAAALDAQLLEIWTDVDGIFSADPRLVPEAFALPEVTFEEAMELAYFGAKVLHPKTIAPVRAARIPVRVCNSFRPEHPGTRVSAGAAPPPHAVRGLSFLGGIALLSLSGSGLKGVPGTAARVFAAMAHEDISVVLITQGSSECSISFCVQQADAARAVQALEEAFEPERAQGRVDAVDRRDGLAILSVVGDGMRQRIGTAGTFLSALAEVGCNVSAIAQGSSERSISAVVAAQDGPRALAHVHQRCFDTPEVLELVVAGVGSVGGELLEQLRREAPRLRAHGVDLRVCALASSQRYLTAAEGLGLEDWRAQLAAAAGPPSLEAHLGWARERRTGRQVFVDCTGSEALAQAYPALMAAGLHVVSANKRANAGALSQWRALREAASAQRRRFLYSTHVGAGLPVLETLRSLLRTGDEVVCVEGILSGSLSLILGLLEEGVSLSQAVASARERRFTEPDPREDLSGMDVARKVLILARELGLRLELEAVQVEPLVPAGFDGSGAPEDFLRRLAQLDEEMRRRVEALGREGKVLRYTGRVSAGGCRVGLSEVPREHPLAAVKGGENAVSLLTGRYSPTPLVIRGYGAGAAVTAAGLLADVLRLVEGRLR